MRLLPSAEQVAHMCDLHFNRGLPLSDPSLIRLREVFAAAPARASELRLLYELEALRERYRPADVMTPLDVVVASMTETDRRRHEELTALLISADPS